MINWHSIPMARLLIPLTFGFVVGYYAQESWPALFTSFILAFIVWLLARFTNRLNARSTLTAIVWQLIIIGSASLLMHSKQYQFAYKHYSQNKAIQFWIIEVKEWVKHNKDQQILLADVKALWIGHQWQAYYGKIRIKCPDSTKTLHADGKWFMVKAETLKDNYKPSFKAWLAQNNLAHIVQINAIQELPIQVYHLKQSNNFRIWILNAILPHFNTKTKGMVEAILLGMKDHVAASVISLMKVTGTLHVLAVSGMHAALIFSILSIGLKWMRKNNIGNLIYAFICLSVLWVYCFMTGASASVLRATIMCSLVLMADLLKRKGQTLNTLFATGLIMLLWDPFTLFDAGFQLSFTAVMGILIVYPSMQTLYSKQTGITKWLLDSLNMSFSAQCLSVQISWYYFLQYPTYSLIANLLIVPLYSILLIAILLCLPIYQFSGIIECLAKGIELLIEFGNTIMLWMSKWPFALYQFKSSALIELCVLYIISYLVIIGCSSRNIHRVQLGLGLSICFLIWKQIFESAFKSCFTALLTANSFF